MRYLVAFLLLCSCANADDIFKPTGRYAKQWFLASEEWCVNCPAGKAKFEAKGWSKKNILTVAEVKARFGFEPPHLPFEFPEDYEPVTVSSCAPERTQAHIDAERHLLNEHGITVAGLTLEQMEAIHDKAHGGSRYHFPGRVSMATGHPVNSSVSNCPSGVCPTSQRVTITRRWGWFGRRR